MAGSRVRRPGSGGLGPAVAGARVGGWRGAAAPYGGAVPRSAAWRRGAQARLPREELRREELRCAAAGPGAPAEGRQATLALPFPSRVSFLCDEFSFGPVLSYGLERAHRKG